MNLQIGHCQKEGVQILRLRGPLVIGESESLLRETILQLVKTLPVNIILDFAEAKEIDDDGLGALVLCHARVVSGGGALKLLNLTRAHMDLFILLKLDTVFESFTNEHDAIDSFFPDRVVAPFDILEFVEEQNKRSLATHFY